MRVVADTNVLLSALIFGGSPEEIINLARDGQLDLLVSSHILLELAKVLKSKFDWREADVADAVRSIGYSSQLVKPETVINKITDDADNRVLSVQ